MSRRRYISTRISMDARVNRLATVAGDFAALLYTWMIPHAEDDGCLTGDVEELLMLVLPGRRDKSPEDVAAALEAMADLGLIAWVRDGPQPYVAFPAASFYAYQSYVPADKRRAASAASAVPPVATNTRASAHQRPAATISAEPRAPARIRVSPSPSPSDTPSPARESSPGREYASGAEKMRADVSGTLTPSRHAVARVPTLADACELPKGVDTALWQCAVEQIGHSPTTPIERTEWQNWLRQLVAARASPEQIIQRSQVYRQRYGPDIPLTLRALVKHWSELAHSTNGGSSHDRAVARRAEDRRLAAEKQRLADEILGDRRAAENRLRPIAASE